MLTIWKYPLEVEDSQLVSVPKGAKFLSLVEQNNQPVLYALVDTHQPLENVRVLIRGTGHVVEDNIPYYYKFLGTAKTHSGRLAWHVFVLKEM